MMDEWNLAWHSWSGDAVFFDRTSGESWMMERPAGDVLKAFKNDEALTVPQIRDRVVQDDAPPTRLGGNLDEVIATLIELGILIRFEDTRPVD